VTEVREEATAGWRKLAALVLATAAVGLPVNHIAAYALLVVAAVVIFSGTVSARPSAWAAAIGVVVVALAGQWLLAPPRIDEGHNVFRPGGAGVLERELPGEVYRHLTAEFAAQYPNDDKVQGGFPDRAFAFSADGIFGKPALSRTVTGIDFSDPVWLRLGFINENRYNWYGDGALKRLERARPFWMGWRRWHLLMPWFEMIRLPPALAGGELCWRGELLWEGDAGHFATLPNGGCRVITPADAGRRIVGSAIKPDSLAMHLTPPLGVHAQILALRVLALAAVFAIVAILIRVRSRRVVVPIILLGLASIVIAVVDLSFLGALRPFEGGDDGLFYDGIGRIILQKMLAGDIFSALRGGEDVFYYGGPGLRYFRALEHILFGETYLGYASLVLFFPFAVHALFRRFVKEQWALAVVLIFIALPVGALFGTTFFQYLKWAARGFADPAAYILFIAGIIPIVGATAAGPGNKFSSGFFGALLLALGIFMKPIVAPAAAVLLGGAGLIALTRGQLPRLAGLCVGFLPVLVMPLHNWIYGHVLVLFSANADNSIVLVMPPSAYVSALHELLRLDFSGEHIRRWVANVMRWLAGPSEASWPHDAALVDILIPMHAAAVAVLVYVVALRRFEPWLRLIGAAALAQHAVAFFYDAGTSRYHFLTWFLTMLVGTVWVREVGIGWLKLCSPVMTGRIAAHPVRLRLASGLAWLQKVSA
jgi:hypothetical protein